MSKRIILFFIIIFVLSSCSRIEFATNWADTFVASLADHYFDTSSFQSRFIKRSLQDDIKKIRVQIYPRIAIALDKVLTEFESNKEFNLEMINTHEQELHSIFNDSLKILEPSTVEFVSLLSPKQLEYYKKEFKDKTDDLKDDIKTKELVHERQFEKMKKQFENWIGSLTSDQKKDINDFCNNTPFPFKEQINNREKVSNLFVENFSNVEKRKRIISDLMLNYESFRDPDYSKIILEYQKNYFEFIVKIINKLTIEQKKRITIILTDRIFQLKASAVIRQK